MHYHPCNEYQAVFSPFRIIREKNKNGLGTRLERTQKFALRVCCKNWTASYPDLLDSCQVSTLSNRRKIARLCHIYKIIYGLADCQMAPITRRVLNYSSRRSNPVQLQTLFAQTSHFQFSFFPLSISQWNNLPLDINHLSLLAFKRSLI